MNKLVAIIKREYLQKVRTKFFVIMTVLGPLMLVGFTVVPGLLLSIKAGGDTRIAVLDQTEGARLYQSFSESLLKSGSDDPDSNRPGVADAANSNSKDQFEKAGRSARGSFRVEKVNPDGRSLEEIKRELNSRIGRNELDGYLVIPPDILGNSDSKSSYYGRNVGDVFTRGQLEDKLNSAVRRQRLIKEGVKDQDVDALSRSVDLATYQVNEKGEEGAEDSGAGFAMVFIIAFLIYMTVLMYGQVVLGAIIEEKRISAIRVSFSSMIAPRTTWPYMRTVM